MQLKSFAYKFEPICPRVERNSRRVFVPLGLFGVVVARLGAGTLVRETTLTCVKGAYSVHAVSPDTIYALHVVHPIKSTLRHAACVVNTREDRQMLQLQKPDTVGRAIPSAVAVLGDNVMVAYTTYVTENSVLDNSGISELPLPGDLVIYRHLHPEPVRVIPWPGGLRHLSAISTDCQSHFLLTDMTKSVFVMDVNGNLRHRVSIDSKYPAIDCAVVNRQLWVGFENSHIVTLSLR